MKLSAGSTKKVRFPEGTFTEREWVGQYADRVEEYRASYQALFDRRKFNQMDGDEQAAYEARLREKANKPLYRAWKGETFHDISKETYLWAKTRGVPS